MPKPYHTFDEREFERNLKKLSRIHEVTGANVLLAFKGYIPWHSSALVERYLQGVSISSFNESEMAAAYFPSLDCHSYCPAFIPSQFAEIQDNSTAIVFNSQSEYMRYKDRLQPGMDVDLRINIQHTIVDSQVFDGYNPNKPYSRFGVTASELDESIFDEVPKITGLHIHCLNQQGSEDLEEMVIALEKNFKWLLEKPEIKRLNLGGGHTITEPDYNFDLLLSLISRLQEEYDLTVSLEPSEFVFLGAGTLTATVLDIVRNDIDIAILNVSAKNHMPDVLESPYYYAPLKEGEYQGSDPYQYTLAGHTCLTGDVIGRYSFDKELKVGDTLTFLDQTAYTLTQSHRFNGIAKPDLKVIGLDGKQKLHLTDTFDQYHSEMVSANA